MLGKIAASVVLSTALVGVGGMAVVKYGPSLPSYFGQKLGIVEQSPRIKVWFDDQKKCHSEGFDSYLDLAGDAIKSLFLKLGITKKNPEQNICVRLLSGDDSAWNSVDIDGIKMTSFYESYKNPYNPDELKKYIKENSETPPQS